jgi:hypothetical protein
MLEYRAEVREALTIGPATCSLLDESLALVFASFI